MLHRLTGGRDLAACLFLVVASLIYHLPALTSGLIAVQDDTRVFYFPLLVVTAQALSELSLPLWTPGIFAGYPLFADGEAGMLYPLHYLVLPWLAPEVSLVVLRILHSFLASLFTYFLMRTLGTGAMAGIVGGLIFAYSGFAAGQIIHDNVFHAMVWLPLALALAELALRAQGADRIRFAISTGVVIGIQALAAHIQVTLMSAAAVTAFCLYRGVLGGRESGFGGQEGNTEPLVTPPVLSTVVSERILDRLPRPPTPDLRPLLGAVLIVAVVGVVSVGLSAAQLLPLYELGTQSSRGNGLGAPLAATNSVWPGDVLTLLLPRLHDTPTGGFWGPWVKWETVLYVGVLPLALAGIGLVARGGRYRLFFGGLALVALVLSFGYGAPASLWAVLHDLPGFAVLQSPGRFSMLLALAVAVLAGHGTEWLAQRTRAGRVAASSVLVGGMALTAGLALALDAVAKELRSQPEWSLALFQQYLLLPGVPASVDGAALGLEAITRLAAEALSPANPTTAWQLLLVLGAAVAIGVWLADTRLKWAAASIAIAVVLADTWSLAATFHPLGRVADLRAQVPEVLLADRDGQFRVFTSTIADQKNTRFEPNILLAAGIQEAGGYSSLAPARQAAYARAVRYADNHLLDLWNVRYVVRRLRPNPLPSHGGTSFHPERPLFGGRDLAAGGGGRLLPDGGPARTHELRLIAALRDAADVPDGTQVARIVLTGTDESEQTLEVMAGLDVSDSKHGFPGRYPSAHKRAETAFEYPRENPSSYRYGERLYYARLPVDPPLTLAELRIESTNPHVGLDVFGVGLLNVVTWEVTQARDKAKYQEVYRDDQIRIMRNAAAMPRAFLVGEGRVAPPGRDVLAWMLEEAVDVRRTAVLEGPLPAGVAVPSAADGKHDGVATIQTYSRDRVAVRTESKNPAVLVLGDAYFPGWVAHVDGERAPIMQANYLFRGVIVPPGTHTVTFVYEPLSVAAGRIISLTTLFGVLAVASAYAFAVFRRRFQAEEQDRAPLPLPEPAYGVVQASLDPGLDH